jgi:PAS domain S-box-containing protein
VLVRSIIFKGKPTGIVYIRSDLQELIGRLKRYALIGAAVLSASLAAALLMSSMIGRAIAQPIIRLAETARIVSRDRVYSVRALPSGDRDELAVLIGTFNEMLGQIEERDTSLQSEITGRRHAEDELRESEVRLTGIIGSAMDAIITVDSEQHILLFNNAAEKMFGCPAAEALGRPIARFIPQRFHAGHAGHIRKFGDAGVTNRAMGPVDALWAVRADGQEFQIEASISQIVAGGRKLFTVILRDVTERKHAEEALREQATVLESAQVFVRDMESRIVSWPRGAEKLYGFTAQEALGALSHDLFHTQFPEPLERIEKKLFEAGAWEGELIHGRRDGSSIVVASAWVLHSNSAGKPTRILETNSDITERKRAEAALADQAEELSQQAAELMTSQEALQTQTLLLRSVLDSMAEGLVVADERGNFVTWNPAAEKIMGLGAANVPPEKWSEHYRLFMADMTTPFPVDQLTLVRAIRGEASTAEMFVSKPGLDHGVWIEVTGGPLKNKDGTMRGGVVSFRDITQRKDDEQKIRSLNEELEERVVHRTAQLEAANHELEAFTYSVSHDLRAPLRHIGGFSKILTEDFEAQLPEEARGHLRRIEDGVHRMGLLVDELLNLARVGRHSLRLQDTRLNPIIEEVASLLQPETAGRLVTWEVEQLHPVQCDPILIKQVFQNLIANALKFSRTRERAVIVISQREENGKLAIAVRDNGVGFNMKYTDKLFGVFQRLHRPEDFEGTGIGLATVKRIVQRHGGQVWAEAELDKGATFFFTLASARSSPEATSPINQEGGELESSTRDGERFAGAGA